jgi:hypothetical protein
MMRINTTVSFEISNDITKELLRATQQAFAQVAGELTGRLDDSVSGNYWPWPRDSKRFGGGRDLADVSKQWREGSFNTGSPRSIVDSGQLKQSRDFSLNTSNLTAEWNWNADYAAAVHEGAYINPFGDKSRTVQIPARPWTQAVIEGGTVATGIPVYPVGENLKKYIRQRTG